MNGKSGVSRSPGRGNPAGGAFRDDAGCRKGACRDGMTAGFNAFPRLPRPPVSAIVGSALPLRGAIPDMAGRKAICQRKSNRFETIGAISVPAVGCEARACAPLR